MKKIIVVSAINFRSGGPLSILNDCLEYLDDYLSTEYKIIALVHDKRIIKSTKNVDFIEFPKSIKSYFYRLYYEYVYFTKLSIQIKPYLWLSLHDISPNVEAEIRAVYCHNPAPFYKINKKEFIIDYKFAFFSWFYKYLYKVNISKNDFVIVQQEWLRNEFKKMYNLKECVVSHPLIKVDINKSLNRYERNKIIKFFYPSFPRVFKNFEIICDAVNYLNNSGIDNFEVIITINGTENKYSKILYEKYNGNKNIKFIGLQTRKKIFEIYEKCDCLIFPSKLETWGLPISEYKIFNKPMLLADLKYSYETVGNYDKVAFFNSNNFIELAQKMEMFVKNELIFESYKINKLESPCAENWKELFNILLLNRKLI